MSDVAQRLRDAALNLNANKHPTTVMVMHEAAGVIERLAEQVSDWQNSAKMAADETCTDDEKHCACVPYLRVALLGAERRAEQLEKEVAELKERLESVRQELKDERDQFWKLGL